jgi:hypothetical protein
MNNTTPPSVNISKPKARRTRQKKFAANVLLRLPQSVLILAKAAAEAQDMRPASFYRNAISEAIRKYNASVLDQQ